MSLKHLLEEIVYALVDYPDDVVVREVKGNRTSILEVEVAKGDIGKVIGKRGNNAKAIRTIMTAAGARENCKTVIEILD